MRNDRDDNAILQEVRRRSLLGVAAAGGLFALVLGVLLLFNQSRLREADPLTSAAMEELKARAQEAPDDPQVRTFLREYDLFLRQDYADRMAFRRSGSFLLAGALGLTLLTLHLSRRRTPALRAGAAGERSADGPALLAWSLVALTAFCATVLGLSLRASPPTPFVAPPPGTQAAGATVPAAAAAQPPAAPQPEATQAAAAIASDYRPSREQWHNNWPCFRGPLQNGVDARTLLPSQNAEQTAPAQPGWSIRWKSKLPRKGMNSPIVWEGRVYLSGADSPDTQELYCFAANDGARLWTLRVPPTGGDRQARASLSGDAGFAAPTLVTDGKRICAIFATGDIVAADLEGRLLWSANLGVPQNHYGYASSLTYHDGLVIAQWDNAEGRKLLALSIADGKKVWQTERPGEMAWSSPVILDGGDGPRLLTTAAPFVIAYDPATGKELWRCEVLSGEVAPSASANGKHYFAAMQYSNLTAIRPGGTGDISKTHIGWQYPDNLPDTSSPLATPQRVYLCNAAGFITCLNAATGEKIWEQSTESTFYASPVLTGATLVLCDNAGLVRFLAEGDAFKPLQELNLGEEGGPSPACAGGLLLLRGKEHLFCLSPAAP